MSTVSVRQTTVAARQTGMSALRQQFANHPAVNVGQAAVDAVVAEREPLVIDAQQVQHRGVQVVEVDLVLHRIIAVIVGGAVPVAGFYAAASEPVSAGMPSLCALSS